MIVYSNKWLKTGVVFLDGEPDSQDVGRLLYVHRSQPIEGTRAEESTTLFLDLSKSPDDLLKGFEKNTSYEIRRAKDKDGVVCDFLDTQNERALDDFWDYFQRFSSIMGYPVTGAQGRWWLGQLARERLLDISVAKNTNGEVSAYHVYCRDQKRVRLRHACSMHKVVEDSALRASVGRANRLLFWSDILEFKAQGLMTYDFGGLYAGTTDEQMLRVNKFKEAFGGTIAHTYNCDKACTLMGTCALWLRGRLRKREKSLVP